MGPWGSWITFCLPPQVTIFTTLLALSSSGLSPALTGRRSSGCAWVKDRTWTSPALAQFERELQGPERRDFSLLIFPDPSYLRVLKNANCLRLSCLGGRGILSFSLQTTRSQLLHGCPFPARLPEDETGPPRSLPKGPAEPAIFSQVGSK